MISINPHTVHKLLVFWGDFFFLSLYFFSFNQFWTLLIDRSQYKDRLAGFFLYVSNSTTKDGGFLCFHDLSTVKSTISWDKWTSCSVNGRYVIYYNERKMGFHILSSTQNMHSMNCVKLKYMVIFFTITINKSILKFPFNVKVHLILKLFLTQKGCNSSFGENCSHKCPTNCQGSICDSNTGHCFSCESEYMGLNCSQGVFIQTF